MIAAIVWKEYRQQRAIWIAVTGLAIGVIEASVVALGTGSVWQQRMQSIQLLLDVMLLIAVASFGIFSGASLLASEKEDGTLSFLNNLTGRLGPIWRSKLAAGVLLAMSQSMALAAYSVSRGIGDPNDAFYLPTLGLMALAWGLLGGALCGHILTAALTAAPLMALAWALLIPFNSVPIFVFLIGVGIPLAVTYLSRRIFCRDDYSRARRAGGAEVDRATRFFSSWSVVFWLLYRQTRWVFVAVSAGAFLLAGLSNLAPLFVWPVGSLVLGMTCGLAVFAPDQRSGRAFWGNQRFLRGRIWMAKLIAWAAILIMTLTISWALLVAIATPLSPMKAQTVDSNPESTGLFDPSSWIRYWVGADKQPQRSLNAGLFLTLWPLYGFSIALFLGQVSRRPIIALVLSFLIAPVVSVLWLPSYLIGGLYLWQVLTIPLALLLTSRLVVRPWVSDRLWTIRPIVGVTLAALLLASWMAGCLWYRVIEVPDVGTPFDVDAYVMTLPSAKNNRTGSLLHQALDGLSKNIGETGRRFGLSDAIRQANEAMPGNIFDIPSDRDWSVKEEQSLGKWLDALYAERWYADLEQAAPPSNLGVFQVPRAAGPGTGSPQLQSAIEDLRWVVYLRSRQLEFKGDYRGALRLFETSLSVGRTLKNHATAGIFQKGSELESMVVVDRLGDWLKRVGNNKALLKSAAEMLNVHVASDPDPIYAIMAEYFVEESIDPFLRLDKSPLDQKYRPLATTAPWEKARQRRVFNAMSSAALLSVKQASQPWAIRNQTPSNNPVVRVAQQEGLPTASGPASELSASEWGALILQSWPVNQSGYSEIRLAVQNNAFALRGAQIALALRRYLADRGKLPIRPEELVPPYLSLAELPKDSHGNVACWFELEETEAAVIPVMVARVAGASIPLGPSGFQAAAALSEMALRVPLFDGEMTDGVGASSPGEKSAGLAAMTAMVGPGEVTEFVPLRLLVPRLVIHIGSMSTPQTNGHYAYTVPLPAKR